MLNGLIIRHKSEEYDFELTERDADHISDLTAVIEYAPFDREREGLTLNERAEGATRSGRPIRIDESRQVAGDFQKHLKRLANLDVAKMAQVIAFLDLIDLGDLDGSQSNWALEFMDDFLWDVVDRGAAGALHRDPRTILASLSHYLFNYWQWVKDSRDVLKQHPEIFPAPPAEPEAIPEPVATSTKPKPRRARKSGRKAA